MLRATLKGLVSRKLRLLLSVLAVVVGVTFAAGAQVLTETLSRAHADAGTDSGTDLSFLTYLLLGFAAVSVLVGAFLVVNTFSILVAQRTGELALLRAIGASRRQITLSVLVEAFVMGLLAAVLGLGAGIGVGALLALVFAGDDAPVGGVVVPWTAVAGAVVVGVVVTVLAALGPARRASRVPPVAALREATGPDRPTTRRTVAGAILALAGAAGVGVAVSGVVLPLLLGGVLVTFAGVVLLAPALTRPAVSLLGAPLRRSAPGRLGVLNAGRNPRRTASTAVALMIGLTVVSAFGVVGGSSEASLTRQFGRDAHADLFVSAEFGTSNPGRRTFPPAVLDQIAGIAGVREVAGQYSGRATIAGRQTAVSAATDPTAFARLFGITTVDGTLDVRPADRAIVSPGTAKAFGVHVGSRVTMRPSHGAPRTVTVVGLYRTALFDGWYVSPAVVDGFADQRLDFGLVDVADGADVAAVRPQVARLLDASPGVVVSGRAAFTEQLTRQIDRALTYIRLMLGLSVLVAVLGIVNTLALSVVERTREIGLLRAIGLQPGQAVRMIGTEAVVVSTLGGVLGLAAGCGLGTAVARAMRHQGIPDLAYPWPQLAAYLALSVVAGVLAAVLPAARAARTDVLAAVTHE
jgi:putative ABC transport system permease protein